MLILNGIITWVVFLCSWYHSEAWLIMNSFLIYKMRSDPSPWNPNPTLALAMWVRTIPSTAGRQGREISVNFVLYKFTSYFILPNAASVRHRRAINHSIYGNTYVMELYTWQVLLHSAPVSAVRRNIELSTSSGGSNDAGDQSLRRVQHVTKTNSTSSHYNMFVWGNRQEIGYRCAI